MSAPEHQPSPLLFFETINAFQRTEAMRAALELDLFTAIAEGSLTPETLATRCSASERGVRILADYLTVLGFLTKEDGRYTLTPDSAVFLDKRSPAYLGGTVGFLLAPAQRQSFHNLAECVRRGGTALPEEGSVAPDHPMWVAFAKGMAGLMVPAADAMAQAAGGDTDRPLRVLDVAAGHGLFGIKIASKFPRAEVVALDWASVLEVARGNADRAGLDGRYKTLPGSAFDLDWGKDYDLILLTNFLHHFDPAGCERILRKAHAALKEDGRVFTLEFVPNPDRVTPPAAAAFSLTMLANTPAGDAYTWSEYERMLRNSGFTRNEAVVVPATLQQLLISQK